MSGSHKNKLDISQDKLSALKSELEGYESNLRKHAWLQNSSNPEDVQEYNDSVEFYNLRQKDYKKLLHEASLLNAEVIANRNSTAWTRLNSVGKGFNVSAADLLGAPSDFVNWSLRKGTFGLYDVENPYFGSSHLRRNLASVGMGYENIGDLAPDDRAGAVAGEILGSGASMALPIAAVSRGLTPAKAMTMEAGALTGWTGPNLGRQAVLEAYKRPGAFAATEGLFAGGSAYGGGMAEVLAPGDPTSRMMGEMSPLLPTTIRSTLGWMRNLPAIQTARTFAMSKLPGGVEREAALAYHKEIVKRGENPEEVIAALGDYDGNLTPTQYLAKINKSSPALLDIEKTLAAMDSAASKALGDSTRAGFAELRELAKLAQGSGDIQVMRIVAELKHSAHINAMQASRERLGKQLDDAIAKADLKGGRADVVPMKVAASKKAKAALDSMYEKYDEHGKNLWDAIPQQVPLDGLGVKVAMEKLRDQGRLQGITFRPGFGNYDKWLKRWKEGGTVTSGEMMRQRSEFLREARNLRRLGSADNHDLANKYETLAGGILDDLETMPGDAVRHAAEFTRAFRQTYDQPVIRKARVPRTPAGAPQYHEGLALGKAIGSDVGPNIELIRRAVHGKELTEVDGALQSFLHAMAKNTMGVGGKVDEAALGKFLEDHADTLGQFGLKKVLTDVYERQRLVNKFEAVAKKADKTWKESEYYKLLDTTKDLNDVIKVALFEDPVRLKNLYKVAMKSPKKRIEAAEGLKTSIMKNLYDRAVYTPSEGPLKGLVSGYKMQAMLESKMGAKTLREYLLESRVLNKRDLDNVDNFSKELMRIEDSLSAGVPLEDFVGGKPTMMGDALAGLVGAELFSRSWLGRNIGHGIQVANTGAKVGRELISKAPTAAVRAQMVTAMLDASALKALLEVRKTPFATRSDRFAMNLYLTEAGFMSEADAYEQEAKTYDATIGGGARLDSIIEELLVSGLPSRRPQGNIKLSPKQVMARFEREAYEEDTDIGPYALDYVQTYLELSNEERAQVQRELKASHPRLKNKTYTLKRRGR